MNKKLTLMCKNKEIADFNFDGFKPVDERIINKDLLPEMLKIREAAGLFNWLSGRSMDLSRSNARMIAQKMNLGLNKLNIVLFNKALCMTDCYWIRENENEIFEDLSLYRKKTNSRIRQISLNGSYNLNIERAINSELTSIGSFNKAWVKRNGNWWLEKTGSKKNHFAEIFTFLLAKKLGMDIAQYKFNGKYTQTKNFTNENVCLEHYESLKYTLGLNNSEVINMTSLGFYNKYFDMILLDALVCNPDRHEQNFGVLKSTESGRILNLAPIFDNNITMGSDYTLSTIPIKHLISSGNLKNRHIEILEKINKQMLENILHRTINKVQINDEKHLENVHKYLIDLHLILKSFLNSKKY